MMCRALGLPLDKALELFQGKECVVEYTRPPRKPDKAGNARVVRVKEADNGGTVILTVSPFEDTLKNSEDIKL